MLCLLCFVSMISFFFLMIRLPPRSTRTDTLFPYTTLFRSDFGVMGRARFKHFWPPAAAEIDRHNPDTGDPVFRDRDRCTEAAARLVEQRRGNARWRFVARPGRDHRDRKSTRLNSSH